MTRARVVEHARGLLVVVLFATVATALMAPSASDSAIPLTGDTLPHIGGIVQARMALEEGQFPIRVAPWQHHGWRYPIWQFYSPLPYTLAGLAYRWITPANPYVAYKLMLWAALVVGGLFTYRLSAWLTRSRPAGLVAGALYMAAPYFLINIHARGAFPEAVAQGVLPAGLYYSARWYAAPRLRLFVPAAVSWFALATTHTITFIFGSLFVGLWLLLLGGSPRRNVKRVVRVGLAYGFGCLLALYFLVPVMSVDYLRIRGSLTNPYDMNWLTPLPSLLSPISVAPEPQPSFRDLIRNHHSAVGWPMLLAAGVVTYALLLEPALLRSRLARRVVPASLVIFWLALAATWSPVDFWSWLPRPFFVAQFSYRLLTQVMWAGALLGAFGFAALVRGRPDARHVAVALFAIGVANSSWLPSPASGPKSVDDLVREPDLGYGRYDYLTGDVPSWVRDGIAADVELPLVYDDGWLMLDRDVDVRSVKGFGTASTALHVVGDAPTGDSNPFREPIRLTATLDGDKIGTLDVGPGPFVWDVPLGRALTARGQSGNSMKLFLAASKAFRPIDLDHTSDDQRKLAVRAQSITITGLRPERSALPVGSTASGCGREGLETICQLDVPQGTALVQLPVLYYPGLLDIRVDGEPSAYRPLVHRSYLLTGLELSPGRHLVRVRYEGIGWANWTSGAAWLAALVTVCLSSARVNRIRVRMLQPRPTRNLWFPARPASP